MSNPTPVTEEVTTPAISPQKKKSNSRAQARRIRNGIIATVVVASLAAGGLYLKNFLTKTEEVDSELFAQQAGFGSIESRVQGSGMARAKETSAITVPQNGIVSGVFVMPGDIVMTGQPLYTITSPEAEEAVAKAQEQLDALNGEMADLLEKGNKLSVTAPFSGKLSEITEYAIGDEITEGTTIATIVNDKTLKLSLYFSYAYENMISVGQSVDVSVPTVMGTYTGTVEKINKVSFISPEGGVYFQAVITFSNPGTLTAGMAASASMTASDGSGIYPYENTELDYYETRAVRADASGPVLSSNLLQYANVSAGQTLVTLGSDTIQDEIKMKQDEINIASDALASAQSALGNFNAVAPIDGRVTSTSAMLVEGGEIKAGETTVVISNTTNMSVEITVDDRNISFVKPGMTVELSDWNGNSFMGIVNSINTDSADMGMGMTNYPVILSVDNFDGRLMDGAWLDYSFVTSQSEACVQVPSQSVMYVSAADGETYTVVFIEANSKPENAIDIDIPETMPGEKPKYPTEKEGYYPVAVETGISDSLNVEITSGLNGDETVFVSYIVNNSWE